VITGVVNANLDATVPLTVYDSNGQPQQIEATIDTGFDGYLALPPALIVALALPWVRQHRGYLADGTLHAFEVHAAPLLRDGHQRIVEAQAVEPVPLIGTRLLHGYILRIEVIAGGSVTIEVRP
jgi:clan AA aspartic protease